MSGGRHRQGRPMSKPRWHEHRAAYARRTETRLGSARASACIIGCGCTSVGPAENFGKQNKRDRSAARNSKVGTNTMPLSRDYITREAERFRFEVKGFEPGEGVRADVILRCERTDQRITIGIFPWSSESDLARTLSMASAELRP